MELLQPLGVEPAATSKVQQLIPLQMLIAMAREASTPTR